MAAPELEQLWQDPRHWTASILYHCTADPRVIVPRQRRWGGWTLNFAHRSAWLVLLGAMAIAVAPTLIVVATGYGSAPAVLAAVALSILVLCFGAAWESERQNFGVRPEGTEMGLFTWLFKNRSSSPREYGIFVSYSRRDGDIVKPLVEMLRISGTGVFRDVDHIKPGTKWRAVLIEAVDSCELLLLFWCHHSANSSEVEKEYTQALQGGKLLTPVLLDDTPLSAALSEYQAIDMRGLFLHQDAKALAEETKREQRAMVSMEALDEARNRMMTVLGSQLGVLESQRQV